MADLRGQGGIGMDVSDAQRPATKGMSCFVAERDSNGNVQMVEKEIGSASRGGLDDYRAQSKDSRVNPGGGGGLAPTTVLAAASAGDLGALRAFLDAGGDVEQAMPRTGTTALMLAAHKGHADCVQCLLEHGADSARPDDADGLTAMMLACSVVGPGQAGAVAALLAEKFAPATAAIALQRDCEGRTPLLYASRRGHIDAARAVLAAEPTSVNICDETGTSPVAAAAANGHLPTLELLLAGSGDPVLADEMGLTPLHLAVVQGHSAVITALLGAGASPDTEDDDGYTPASEAIDIGDPDVLTALGLPAPERIR